MPPLSHKRLSAALVRTRLDSDQESWESGEDWAISQPNRVGEMSREPPGREGVMKLTPFEPHHPSADARTSQLLQTHRYCAVNREAWNG